MAEPTLTEVKNAFTELRETVERKDAEAKQKLERVNAFLDEAEEKIFQPLARAAEEEKRLDEVVKGLESEKTELKAKLEEFGASPAEVKQRIDALELEIARYKETPREEPKDAWKAKPESKAFTSYLQHGYEAMPAEEKQVLRTDRGPDGGFMVAPEIDSALLREIVELDPIRSLARVRPTGVESLLVVIRDSIPVASYVGQTETSADSTSKYKAERLDTRRITHTGAATMESLMNPAFDLEAELLMDARLAFSFGEGEAFVNGTDPNEPQGFVAHPTLQANARASGVSGELTPESILRVTGDLKVGYNPTFVLNRRTLAEIRTFRADAVTAGDASGGFLWMPGLGGPTQATLAGFPYILANSMPDIASDAFPVAFGDFGMGYTIVDRTGMAVIRDEFSRKRDAIVEFQFHRWNTGRVVLPEAIKLIQIDT